METTKKTLLSRPVLSQTQNNTTLWVGHSKVDTKERIAGQTFTCPGEGKVNNIQVYASSIQNPGDVSLTLHEFDAASKTWGPAIGQSNRNLQMDDVSKWIRFELEPIALQKDSTYGFRIQTEQAYIGIGEAASKAHTPFLFGCAWNSNPEHEKGRFFKYFSLAFKVELCA